MKLIDSKLLDALTEEAKDSHRKRANFNLHPDLRDPIQRLCVAIEPDTYIRPHRHADPATSEVFLLLRGSVVVLFFDDSGQMTERVILSAGGRIIAAEIPANTWHSAASLESGTIFFEVKQGPYRPIAENNYASWAPAEGRPEASGIVSWYKTARIADSYSAKQKD